MADDVTFRFVQRGPAGMADYYELYSDDGLFAFLKPSDIAPLAKAALATLKEQDPAAHRALVAEAARQAGLRVLTAEQADDVAPVFGDHIATAHRRYAGSHGGGVYGGQARDEDTLRALRGQPRASERSGERG